MPHSICSGGEDGGSPCVDRGRVDPVDIVSDRVQARTGRLPDERGDEVVLVIAREHHYRVVQAQLGIPHGTISVILTGHHPEPDRFEPGDRGRGIRAAQGGSQTQRHGESVAIGSRRRRDLSPGGLCFMPEPTGVRGA